MISYPVQPDALGRIVRETWVAFCVETGHTANPGHIEPWENLDEWGREVDRRIAVAVANAVLATGAKVCDTRREQHRQEIARGVGSRLHERIVNAKLREAQECAIAIRMMGVADIEAALKEAGR